MGIAKQIEQKLSKVNLDTSLVLVVVDVKGYNEATIQLIKYLNVGKKFAGIYVTVSKPYKTVKAALEGAGVNTRIILFIDAVSGSPEGKESGCLFIGSPQDLTGISIAMSEAVKALPAKGRFLLFDSLSTLSIHNSPGSVAKFAHFLATNMRKWEISGFIILIEKEKGRELIDQLAQFCDVTLELGGGK
jgi:hypothetical protein